MKIKKNGNIIELSDSELKRIVENSGNVDEGIKSTFKGIGGMFKGTGYSYTKYAYELTASLKDINEELEETIIQLEKILDKSNRSSMTNQSYERLSKHIAEALEGYQMVIETNEIIIEDLDNSVTSERDTERPR
jgi:hypothetical protein